MRHLRWAAIAAVFGALALLIMFAPDVDAQSSGVSGGGEALIHRTEIEEGQDLNFEISDVPAHPKYFVYVPDPNTSSYTANAFDFIVRTPDGQGGFTTIGAGSGEEVFVDSVSKRIRLEISTNRDVDTDDETFGVMLCTTDDCTGGTILGDWTITIKDAPEWTAISGGTNVTVSHSGNDTSMMEKSRNNDGSDTNDKIRIVLGSRPDADIVILGRVNTQVGVKLQDDGTQLMRGMVRFASSPASGDLSSNAGDWWVVGHVKSTQVVSGDLTLEPLVTARDNIDDTAGPLTGNLEFKIVQAGDHGGSEDTDYTDNPAYAGTPSYTFPAVPVSVTDDDEITSITLKHAATKDKIATEGTGAGDTAKFRIALSRALVAGENLTVPLVFNGATLGTHFTLSLDGSPTGVAYADSTSVTGRGEVTFTGPSAAEATVVVTATNNDGDTVSNNLRVLTFRDHQTWRDNYFPTNIDGGVCAGEACKGGNYNDRLYYLTLRESSPGLTVIDDNDEPSVTEGNTYGYSVRLNTAPTANVTVAVTSGDARLSVTTGASRTFTSSNWSTPQTVTLTAVNNNADVADADVTITHDITGTGTYASIADVTHVINVEDDDATVVTMTGTGVRTTATGTEISEIMVEGDTSRVDRSLTISLGRALEDGEYVRVPLYLESTGHRRVGSSEPCVLSPDDDDLTVAANTACDRVEGVRGPRYSANVAWPEHYNDFVMTATGTGASIEAVNRRTPNHVGYRYLEFRGAGAQSATIEMHARGHEDGDTYYESFRIELAGDFETRRFLLDDGTTVDWYLLRPDHNLGGGIEAWMDGAKAWFGIEDTAGLNQAEGDVPINWPFLPSGLSAGDKFRLLYVTSSERTASSDKQGVYNTFVRADIPTTGDLAPYTDSFFAIITTLSGTQTGPGRVNAKFHTGDPDEAIYWVNGDKVADDNADFTDGSWDSLAARLPDGTLATIDNAGYWTGGAAHGHRTNHGTCDGGAHNRGQAGNTRVHVGHLGGGGEDATPLGPTQAEATCAMREPATQNRALYALSGVLTVVGGAEITPKAEAAEGSAITFTVTIPEAAPSGGITIPYTLEDGLGIAGDPAYSIATSADYSDGSGGSITIAQGATTGTITVNTTQDSTYESDHYFRVVLGTPSGTNAPPVNTRKNVGSGVITDDDMPEVALSQANVSVGEGAGTVAITVTRTGATEVPLSIYWTTADGTAASGDDYESANGYLEFAAGDSSKTITVTIIDDDTAENSETLKVQLNADLAVDTQVGSRDETTITITDDDQTGDVRVTWSQTDDSALEPNTEITEGDTFTVKVSLSAPAASDVTIPISLSLYGSGSGDAAADDFTVPTGVDIAMGQSSATFDIEATVDNLVEVNESFRVDMCFSGCPAGYTVGPTAVGNDFVVVDGTVLVTWSQTDDSELPTSDPLVLKEGDTYTIKVSLASAPSSDVAIPISITGNGSDANTADYTAPSSVTILSGQTSATFDITATSDNTLEDRDSFNVVLCPTADCPAGYSSGSSPARWFFLIRDVSVVTDVSGLPDGSGGDKQINEGESATFTVRPEVDPTVDVTFTIKVVDDDTANAEDVRDNTASEHIAIDTDPNTAGFQDELTFTGGNSGNWSTPQTVRVYALYDDDADTGSANVGTYRIGYLNSAASGPYMSLVNTDFQIINLQVPDAGHGVVVSETSVEVEESDTVTYHIQPKSDPGGTVTITPTSGVTTTATVSGAVSFDTSNWNTPKSVTVTGVAAGTTTVTHAVTTATTDYPTSTTIGSVGVTVTSSTLPDLNFAAATYSVAENAGNVDVVVSADTAPATDLTVTLGAANGTAIGGRDFTAPAATFTFPANATSHTISVAITDDRFLENDETFNLTLTAATGYTVGSTATTTVTITDQDTVTVEMDSATVSVTEGGSATITVVLDGDTNIPVRVTLTPADGTATGSADGTGADYNNSAITPVTIPAGASSVDARIMTTDDSTAEPSETFTVTLSVVSGQSRVSVASPTSTTVTIEDNDTVNVTMSKSGGDADGNAVEGASDSTGYVTVTLTLDRALTGSETVTVPLTVQGATVATDYTFALQPSSQTGVSLTTTGGTHTAQNPAVVFASGASEATLRLTPVNNSDRTEPYVVVSYGTGTRAPSASVVTLGDTSGDPVGVVLVDDETGAFEVPADWALKPAAVAAGGTFRLIYLTSEERDATSTDIDVYNAFVRGVTAATGHANLKPYAGAVTVIGSTPSVDARVNTGIWDPTLNSGSGGYTDSSTTATSAGTAIYFLAAPPTDKTADNYFDFFDNSWDTGADADVRGEATDESGAVVSSSLAFSIWTGASHDGTSYNADRLGESTPIQGNTNSLGFTPLNSGSAAPRANAAVFLAISPVFQVAQATPVATPELSVALPQAEGESRNSDMELVVPEVAAIKTFNLSLDTAPSANLTVCVRVAEMGGADRVTAANEGIKTVTFTSGSRAATLDVSWTDTAVDDRDSAVTVTAVPPTETGCTGAGTYTVSATADSDTARIEDDEATVVSLSSSDMTMTEGDATDTAVITVTLGRRIYAGESIRAQVTLTTSTDAQLPGDTTPDFAAAISGTGTTNTGTSTNELSILFTGHDTNTVQTATITLTPNAGVDDGDANDEMIMALLAVVSGRGSGTEIGGGAETRTSDNTITLTLTEDETPQSTVLSITELRVSEISDDFEYRVRLLTAPSGGDTMVTITPES